MTSNALNDPAPPRGDAQRLAEVTRRGRARIRRRRLVFVTTIMSVLLLGGVVAGGLQWRTASQGGNTSILGTPGKTTPPSHPQGASMSPPPNTPTKPDPSQTQCKTTHLSLFAGHHGVAAGSRVFQFVFRNQSQQSCTVQGRPTVVATDASGGVLPFQVNNYEDGAHVPSRMLRPGQEIGFLVLDSSPTNGTVRCTDAKTVSFSLPGSPGQRSTTVTGLNYCRGGKLFVSQLGSPSATPSTPSSYPTIK